MPPNLEVVLLCGSHHTLLHHGAFHMQTQDDDIVFISKDGELIESALQPQFPDVSAEAPLPGQPAIDRPAARLPRKPSVFDAGSDRDIVDMLRFREDWGNQRRERFWQRIVQL